MGRLNLNFLEKPIGLENLNPIEAILHEFGEEIYQYAKGYFNYIVTTSSYDDEIREASLYIIAPEIGYDYKVLTIEYKDVETVTTSFFTLKSGKTESDEISIKPDWSNVYIRISELLNTNVANQTFKFLIDQIELKRENKEDE
jgi:hypothetical protein